MEVSQRAYCNNNYQKITNYLNYIKCFILGYNELIAYIKNHRSTPVTLLRSLSVKYAWERYEPPYPPSYGLNSTTTVLLGE